MKRTILVLATSILLIGCDFDAPITPEPTRRIEPSLLGNWISTEWNSGDCKDRMRVRKLDESTYIIAYNDDLYRAWHSDLGDLPFLSVQNVSSAERKYLYFLWKVSEDGAQITLRQVDPEFVPEDARKSGVANFLRQNARDPKLFGEPGRFSRKE